MEVFTMNMNEFLNKLSSDKELAEKMAGAGDADAAYAIAKETGLTDDFDTFVATMKKVNDAVQNMSEEEVSDIVGGYDTTDKLVTLVTGAASIATVSGLSYAAASL